MKRLFLILSLVVFLFGVSGCENTPVEPRGGGEEVLGGEEKEYTLAGEWDVYQTSKLVGEAVFTETTIYTKYDYAGVTTIMDSKYNIDIERLEYEGIEYINRYLVIPDNYVDSPGHDYTLRCELTFISEDSIKAENFINFPGLMHDIWPLAVSATLVRKGG